MTGAHKERFLRSHQQRVTPPFLQRYQTLPWKFETHMPTHYDQHPQM